MKRVMVTGCGGYAAIGYNRCLKRSGEEFFTLGIDASERFIGFAETDVKALVPINDNEFDMNVINRLLELYKIEFIHAQIETEIKWLSNNRKKINANSFLPKNKTIELCQNKHKAGKIWQQKGIPTAQSLLIETVDDLTDAFEAFQSPLWLRTNVGAGGRGSILSESSEHGRYWIDFNDGWGNFTANEYLPGENLGCTLLYDDGQLITSQTKERLEYVMKKANPMGITGTTGFLRCVSRGDVNKLAEEAVLAVDKKPNGIFSVDFKGRNDDTLCVTEINAGRFHSSSVHLFYKTGVNLAYYYMKLGYGEELPEIEMYNPISEGTVLARQVDVEPKIFNWESLEGLKASRDLNGYAILE